MSPDMVPIEQILDALQWGDLCQCSAATSVLELQQAAGVESHVILQKVLRNAIVPMRFRSQDLIKSLWWLYQVLKFVILQNGGNV